MLLRILAKTLKELDRFSEAEKAVNRAIELDPDNAENQQLLCLLFIRQDDLAKAETPARKAVELEGSYANYHNLATCLAQQGKFEEAVLIYRKAIEFDESGAEDHQNLGVALCQLKRYKEGEESLLTSVKI